MFIEYFKEKTTHEQLIIFSIVMTIIAIVLIVLLSKSQYDLKKYLNSTSECPDVVKVTESNENSSPEIEINDTSKS